MRHERFKLGFLYKCVDGTTIEKLTSGKYYEITGNYHFQNDDYVKVIADDRIERSFFSKRFDNTHWFDSKGIMHNAQKETLTAGKSLFDDLKEINDICRSMMEIVKRRGANTNWVDFETALETTLKRQHELMFPVNEYKL